MIAYLSAVYAATFLADLCSLYNLLRGGTDRQRTLGSLVLVGGVGFVALHAFSDIGITGLLGTKLASFGAQHDPGVAYTLYLVTFVLFFLQAFGLGGVIASFGLVLDLIAFVLFLIFVLVSSVILLTRANAAPTAAVEISR